MGERHNPLRVRARWFSRLCAGNVSHRLSWNTHRIRILSARLARSGSSGEHAAESALPRYLSEKRLAGIAESIVEPFNAGDFDGLYSVFDPAVRAQISADTIKKQLSPLRPSIGKIETASYVGWQKIPSQGTLPIYQLQYNLKLSGGDFVSGTLSVKIRDHGDHEGVIFFFVGGTTPN